MYKKGVSGYFLNLKQRRERERAKESEGDPEVYGHRQTEIYQQIQRHLEGNLALEKNRQVFKRNMISGKEG